MLLQEILGSHFMKCGFRKMNLNAIFKVFSNGTNWTQEVTLKLATQSMVGQLAALRPGHLVKKQTWALG